MKRFRRLLSPALVLFLVAVVMVVVWDPAPEFTGGRNLGREEEPFEEGERDEAEAVRKRQRWFVRQRSFGAGIPRRAMARAFQQSRGLREAALLVDPATNIAWRELGPRAVEFRAAGSPTGWTNYGGVGALSGRVTSIVPHPTDSNVAYVGTANGGVWKTTNGGVNWTPSTDGQLASLSIGAITLDPSNPDVIYAGTGEANSSNYYGAGVYRSLNEGATWQKIGGTTFDGCTISGIGVKPGVPNTILVAVQGRWALRPGGASGWCNNRGVWQSTNGGANWTRVLYGSGGAAWDLHVAPNNPNVWFATIGWDGVYRSTSSGALGTWTKLTNGLPAGEGRIEVDVAASGTSQTQTLYAAFTNGSSVSVYSSTNGGASWTPLVAAPRSAEQGYGFCGWGQCNYDLVLEIDPRNTNRFFLGGVWLNRYDFGTPSVISYHKIHVDFHALAMDAFGRLWVGSDGGVYRSSDGGVNYTNLNADLALTQYYPGISGSLGSRLMGGTQDNGTSWYSGSDAWTMIEVADGAYSGANRTTALPAFVSRYNLQIFKINNTAGSPCRNLETRGIPEAGNKDTTPFIAPMVMHPTSPSILYAGSRTLYRSINANLTACGSTTWSPYATGFGTYISTIGPAPSDTGVVYVGLQNGQVFVRRASSGWSGDTFASITDKRWITDFAVDPSNSSIAYVARSGFGAAHVYKTTNAGVSWQNVSGNLPNTPVNALVFDPRTNVLYAGTDVGLYWTENGGVSWQNTSIGLPAVVISDLLLDTTANRLVAATYGRGMWSAVPVGFGQVGPANDTFGGATGIGALPFSRSGIDTSAATETGEPQPSTTCATGVGKTVWFRYQPSSTQEVSVDTQGSNFDTVLTVYRGTTLPGLTEIKCDDDGAGQNGGPSKTSFTAQAGQTYYIQAGGWRDATNPPASGSLSFNASAIAPANDAFANATAISSLPFSATGVNTTSATAEASEPQPSTTCATGVGKTLWYRFQPGTSQNVNVDTAGSNFDTVLAVYRGTTLPGLTQVACDDDGLGQGGSSKTSFTAEAGQTYYIQAGGWKDATTAPKSGSLNLNVTGSGLANDSFAGASQIGALPFTQSGVNTSSATETGEPQPSTACTSGVGKTLWYRFQPGSTETVSFDTQGSNFDTVVVVYRGTTLPGLTQVACDDDFFGSGAASKATFSAEAGQTYYIQVGGWKDNAHAPASGSLNVRLAAS